MKKGDKNENKKEEARRGKKNNNTTILQRCTEFHMDDVFLAEDTYECDACAYQKNFKRLYR